jgi:ABC-type nitrate/sulfonate/bicarbonate transport system substrate-binding protein
MPSSLSRRSLFRNAGMLAIGAAIAPEVLAACASSSSSSGSTAASAAAGAGPTGASGAPAAALADVSIQLNYLENVQFAGTLMALGKGYYQQNGLNVTVLPGGPNVAPEPVVASGKALVGVTHTAEGAQAIVNGAPLTIIGAAFQKSPTCIISKASNPIKTPKDMIGKTIGISDTNMPIWTAFLKVNGISASQVKVSTVEFSTQPLADGQIDAIMGFYSNEPIILAEQGVKTYTFLLADSGYPLVDDIYIVANDSLTDPVKRKQVIGLMTAEALGWKAALADPATAANYAVNVYGKDLKLSMGQQVASMKAEQALVSAPDTGKHGLLWMSPELTAQTIKSLALGGTKATTAMFSSEVLAEVYKNGIIA